MFIATYRIRDTENLNHDHEHDETAESKSGAISLLLLHLAREYPFLFQTIARQYHGNPDPGKE